MTEKMYEELKEALGRLANFVERLRKEKNL